MLFTLSIFRFIFKEVQYYCFWLGLSKGVTILVNIFVEGCSTLTASYVPLFLQKNLI